MSLLFIDVNNCRSRFYSFGNINYSTNPIVNSAIRSMAEYPVNGYYKEYETWTIRGTFHNENAPAVINHDGNHEWYDQGNRLSAEKEKLLNIWWNKNHTFESVDF